MVDCSRKPWGHGAVRAECDAGSRVGGGTVTFGRSVGMPAIQLNRGCLMCDHAGLGKMLHQNWRYDGDCRCLA